jgi:CRP-like cAMP-binding protein
MKKLTIESFREHFPEARERKYGKNQIICYEGDRPHSVFFVVSGHIKYYDINEEGQEKILHIIGPHNIFPMLYAFDVAKDIDNFYAAVDNVVILTIPLDKFKHLIKTDVKFCHQLTQWFLTEIEHLVLRIGSLEKTDSREKTLHALKFLTMNYGQKDGEWEKLNFTATQQFLADFTGLTRETISSVLHDLEKEQAVKTTKGRLTAVRRTAIENIVAI